MKESIIQPLIDHNVKLQKHHLSKVQAKRARVLCGLLAIGISMSGASPAFGQQSLHVVSSPPVNDAALTATVAIANNNIWAVGDLFQTNMTFAEQFNGSTWSLVSTPAVRGGHFTAIAAAASNDVWAVGYQAAGSSFTTLIEHWNGTGWSVVSSPNVRHGAFLSTVAAISSNDVWAAGSVDNFSGILMEHWNGTSWSIFSSPTFTGVGPINGISADASNDVWAVGGATILHWNGQSWSVVPGPSRFGGDAVVALSPSNVWAVGTRPGLPPSDTEAAIAHWDGTSWSFVSSPNPNPRGTSFLGVIAAVSANNIWAFGGGIFEHWDGTSWSIISNPSLASIKAATALSDGTVVAVGEGSDGGAVILEN